MHTLRTLLQRSAALVLAMCCGLAGAADFRDPAGQPFLVWPNIPVVRATDLDNRTRGWAGRLGTREERLPIELDPSVAEAELFGRTSVRVDAALVFREKGRSRELKPARIYVRKVHAS